MFYSLVAAIVRALSIVRLAVAICADAFQVDEARTWPIRGPYGARTGLVRAPNGPCTNTNLETNDNPRKA